MSKPGEVAFAAARMIGAQYGDGFRVTAAAHVIEAALDEAATEPERTIAALEAESKILHEELTKCESLVVALRKILAIEQEKHDAWVQYRGGAGFDSDIRRIAYEAVAGFGGGDDD